MPLGVEQLATVESRVLACLSCISLSCINLSVEGFLDDSSFRLLHATFMVGAFAITAIAFVAALSLITFFLTLT